MGLDTYTRYAYYNAYYDQMDEKCCSRKSHNVESSDPRKLTLSGLLFILAVQVSSTVYFLSSHQVMASFSQYHRQLSLHPLSCIAFPAWDLCESFSMARW
jgi:hypothetical protein